MVEFLNSLLKTAKRQLMNLATYKKILVVLGNESCDLDSAISSIMYSLLLHHLKTSDTIVIPLFNVHSVHLPIKTEVVYVLRKFGVDTKNIVCRDELDLLSLQSKGSLQLTLVDHHSLQPSDRQLASSVTAVVDHHLHDPAWPWLHVDLTILPVGSCCTLVAEKLLSKAPELVTPKVASMILGTILLDTACLSLSAGRATALDQQMVDRLQQLTDGSINNSDLFTELQAAKSDISSLTLGQLLMKDLKVAGGIPIVGLPIKVQEFLNRSGAGDAVQKFCEEHNTNNCVIYGSMVTSGTVTRDLVVFGTDDSQTADEIVAALTSSKDPNFGLQSQPCALKGFKLFEQLSVKYTRKHMLPVICSVGAKLNKG